ncbi:uncharacterized protein LOC131948992 [Physella acuta]|uniref:uncharacterized protein LOC131948992 n=1 Tax=Physella acuta TaxID=109671 RepID=UPI0027DBA7C5|nr:uncharacterized protein LOC131948992 [Physella acuta]
MGNFFPTYSIHDIIGAVFNTTDSCDQSHLFAGTHEVQECLECHCEADLHTQLASCLKNPGHLGFVPIKALTTDALPASSHPEVYDLIKALGDITVRIAVPFTSLDRPEFLPGTKDPYPSYNTRGQNSLRTGTGRVWRLNKFTEGMDDYRTCPCPECEHSDTPSKEWWNVVIATSTHVVFDPSEALKCRCRLWFDEDTSPVVNVYGWGEGFFDIDSDWCLVFCATHDLFIGDKMQKMVERFDGLCVDVMDTCRGDKDVDKLTIIVSHPHGCAKQVSIGHWVDRNDEDSRWTRYTYTTSTCPGSSGALVYRLGCNWLSNHRHCGYNSKGLNYSGVNVD